MRERKEGWLRRVPDFLPVCLQDQLRHREPAVREHQGEQGEQVICSRNKNAAWWRHFLWDVQDFKLGFDSGFEYNA